MSDLRLSNPVSMVCNRLSMLESLFASCLTASQVIALSVYRDETVDNCTPYSSSSSLLSLTCVEENGCSYVIWKVNFSVGVCFARTVIASAALL